MLCLISTPVIISAQTTEFPNWVKQLAESWSDDQITDSEFGNTIKFLIEKDIIVIESTPSTTDQNKIAALENKVIELNGKILMLENGKKTLKKVNSQLILDNDKLQTEISQLNTQFIKLHKSTNEQTSTTERTQTAKYYTNTDIAFSLEYFPFFSLVEKNFLKHSELTIMDLEKYSEFEYDQMEKLLEACNIISNKNELVYGFNVFLLEYTSTIHENGYDFIGREFSSISEYHAALEYIYLSKYNLDPVLNYEITMAYGEFLSCMENKRIFYR